LSWLTNLFGFNSQLKEAVRSGFYPFHFWGAAPQFNDYTREAQKLAVILSNPALLKVFSLQCDLFSMGVPTVYNKKGVAQPDDIALKRLKSPNPLQSNTDWLWSYMFNKMLGNAYLYMDSDVVERENSPMYWLENHKIEWPVSMDKEKDKLIFSQAKYKRLLETEIVYRYEDGSTFRFPLKDLMISTDLTNGTGNWFKGFSRLDALYKVITNSEASLDSKNINVRYAGKFLVAGTADPNDVTKKILGEDEKKDIEDKTNGPKQVHAVKSLVDIKRFVDDLKVLELDKAFLADFFLIGSMYNIPRDVLELYTSSTYENQEKARAGHVTYTLDPAGEALGSMLAQRWGYTERGWKICFSWDHLPFTQVFEAERVKVQEGKIRIMQSLLKIGVPIEEINVFLNTNFSIEEPEPVNEPINSE